MARRLGIRVAALVLVLTAAVGVAPAGDGAKKYDPAEYNSAEAIAKGAKQLLQKTGIKKISAQDVSKVAIIEFSVEYITKEKELSGAGNSMKRGKFGLGTLVAKATEAAGVGEKQIEIEESLKTGLPQTLYDVLVKELSAAGFEVIPKETIASNPAYETFKTEEAGKKKGESKGMFGGRSKATKTETYPVEGLASFKQGVFSQMSNTKKEAKLMADLGADMTLRVHLRVGAQRKGRPSIEGDTVFNVAAGLRSGEMPGGKMSYSLEHMGTISAKKALAYDTEIVEETEWKVGKGNVITVNSEKYEKALMEMFTPFAKMVVSTL